MKKQSNLKYIIHFSNGEYLRNYWTFQTPILGHAVGIATTKCYSGCLKFDCATSAKEIAEKTKKKFKIKPYSHKPIKAY